MKIKSLAVALGLFQFASFATVANTDIQRIEARLDALEKRAVQAEKRAEIAEAQLAQTHVAPATLPKMNDSLQINSAYGSLKLYGDVEFNMDAASKKGQLTSLRTEAGKPRNYGDREQWDINGRILVGLDGERVLTNNNYAGFSVQPLADMNGKMNLDDAAFYFGQANQWQIKVGRYEAFDMFPLNQDTLVEHSGNTANDLYADGFGYIYMMKEGRGRSNNGGGFMLSSTVDDWYFELNALVEDGTKVFQDEEFHGSKLDNKKNVIYLRPVIAWQKDNFNVAVGAETNVIHNAYGYRDANGNFHNQSRRNGYGLKVSWDNLADDPENGMVINWNTAFLDAKDENDFTTGINGLWRKFELGYIYAHNDIKAYRLATSDNDYLTLNPGTYNIHTVHASYELPNILDIDNFKIFLGAYYSHIDGNDIAVDSKDKERYGARVRFKYFF